jgi:hypothetical protein
MVRPARVKIAQAVCEFLGVKLNEKFYINSLDHTLNPFCISPGCRVYDRNGNRAYLLEMLLDDEKLVTFLRRRED